MLLSYLCGATRWLAFLTPAPVLEISKVLAEQQKEEAKFAKDAIRARDAAFKRAQQAKEQEFFESFNRLAGEEQNKEQAEQNTTLKAAYAEFDKVLAAIDETQKHKARLKQQALETDLARKKDANRGADFVSTVLLCSCWIHYACQR